MQRTCTAPETGKNGHKEWDCIVAYSVRGGPGGPNRSFGPDRFCEPCKKEWLRYRPS